MSPLTKVFVVLLVVASLLQTAGTIVFVNKVRPLQTQLDAAKASVDTARAQMMAANTSSARAEEKANAAMAASINDRKAAESTLAVIQGNVNAATVQIAQLNSDKASRDQQINTLTAQLQWASAQNQKFQDQVKDLRDRNDTLVKHQEEDSRKIAELTNLSETVKAEFDHLREQHQILQENFDTLSKAWTDKTGTPVDQVIKGGYVAVNGGSAGPAITGKVTDKKVINGNTYVTVNVGGADGVAKGMQFYVVDGPNLLGIVTIDTVDNNDAVGKLSGEPDKVTQVQAGNDAKTQLRGS